MDTQAPQQQAPVMPQQGVPPVLQQPVQPAVQSSVQQPLRQPEPSVQPMQPVQPVGGGKEASVMPSQEWVSPSTPEVVLPQEVAAAGIEAKPVMPNIPQPAQQAGVVHAKEAVPATPVKAEPLGLKTPRSALLQLKNVHKKVTDGFSWLVRLVIKEQDKKERGPVAE